VTREGASITELAEELGHSPQMRLNTYAHVIDELRGAPRRPAEQEIARARSDIGHITSGLRNHVPTALTRTVYPKLDRALDECSSAQDREPT
jgi:hypothetical protein